MFWHVKASPLLKMDHCELDCFEVMGFLCKSQKNNKMELLFLLYCKSVLDFGVPDYRYYNSLGLSVLDASFSATARYSSVENVLARFCKHYDLSCDTFAELPKADSQVTVSQVMKLVQGLSPEQFAEIVQNRSRVGGRLKAALFLDCLSVLHSFGIETYQDFQAQFENPELETSLRALQGIGEATISYLYMLAGNSDNVKVDRHIRTFTSTAVNGNDLTTEQIKRLFRYAAHELSKEYPGMTARRLDHIVWVYQSTLANTNR